MLKAKKILVAPLDWGIGHASRCVPLINALLELEQKPLIAAGGAAARLLKERFPELPFIDFPSAPIHYGTGDTILWPMLKQLPSIFMQIKRDHRFVETIVQQTGVDAIISDNRFGAYSKKIPSVFITHQLHISMPDGLGGFAFVAESLNRWVISKFGECWVPDFEETLNLAGQLSHPAMPHTLTHYVGPLSRFNDKKPTADPSFRYDFLVMLSGPEPQRSLFEQKIIAQFEKRKETVFVLRGLPGEKAIPATTHNIVMQNHAGDEQIAALLRSSDRIIARAGYSTIMDLVAMQRTALLVATPGQPEQEYLAELMDARSWFSTVKQGELNENSIMNAAEGRLPEELTRADKLQNHLRNWLGSV